LDSAVETGRTGAHELALQLAREAGAEEATLQVYVNVREHVVTVLGEPEVLSVDICGYASADARAGAAR
jgi:hypothetical protein